MNKSAYRKFKVKTVAGVDDFASMREVVERRYRRIRDGACKPSDPIVLKGAKEFGSVAANASVSEYQGTTSVVPKRRRKRPGL